MKPIPLSQRLARLRLIPSARLRPHALAMACIGLSTACSMALQAQTPATATEPVPQTANNTSADGQLPEVRISASALDLPLDESATPVEVLDGKALQLRSAATLGETLEGLPGVRNNNYGAGAGRPVIRGADAARVRILSDGSEIQDASTSSPDHAVAFEPLLASEIEVLRGPSSLLYGGGITGGVVNVRDNRIPTAVPEKGYEGRIELRKSSNAREGIGLFSVTGGQGPFALHVEGLKRSAGEYEAGKNWSDKYVNGSNNNTWYGSVGGSFIHQRGYIGLAYSSLRSRYGLPGHSHEYEDCHLHGDALHCASHGGGEEAPEGCHWHGTELHCTGEGEHDDEIALVSMTSHRWDLRGELQDPLPGFTRAKLRASHTDYAHDEIEHGAIGTSFKNKAHDARLELEHQRIQLGAGELRGLIGVQHSRRDFSAQGTEAYVEPTLTTNRALFALQEYRQGDWRFELSGRYEWQTAHLDGSTRRGNVKHDMGSLSGGVSWNFQPGYVLAASVSRSKRAPTAEELFAGGIHLASNTWERGNANLGAEQSNNLDISLGKTSGATRYKVSAFYNRINDYIYASTTDRYENFRLIDYTQRDATFKGLEASASHQLSTQWRVGVFGDMVHARFKGGDAVPRIPSRRLGVNAHWESGPWYAGAEFYRNAAQNRIAAYETRTAGYNMLNLHMGWSGKLGQAQSYELFAKLDNVFDKLAFNNTSFVKDASPLRGRNLVVGMKVNF